MNLSTLSPIFSMNPPIFLTNTAMSRKNLDATKPPKYSTTLSQSVSFIKFFIDDEILLKVFFKFRYALLNVFSIATPALPILSITESLAFTADSLIPSNVSVTTFLAPTQSAFCSLSINVDTNSTTASLAIRAASLIFSNGGIAFIRPWNVIGIFNLFNKF